MHARGMDAWSAPAVTKAQFHRMNKKGEAVGERSQQCSLDFVTVSPRATFALHFGQPNLQRVEVNLGAKS